MKKLMMILLSALSLTAVAQQPNWYNDNQRKMNYPQSQYFTGIAYGEVKYGESVGDAMNRLKTAARVEAVSTIRVHVQNETTSTIHSETIESIDAWSEKIRESFYSQSKYKVDLEIPGLQVEAWQNPNSREVVAFAYIKKSTLARQMNKQITVGLTRIETVMENADQFIANGQKMQAREALKKAEPLFLEVEQAQRILIVADPSSDAESLQLAETRQLMLRYMRMVSELKNGINIYLSCHADMFGNNYSSLKGEIERELSELGCTFVDYAGQSDWAIEVNASARKYNTYGEGSNKQYFVYIDAKISIDKTVTGQRIYEEQVKPEKGAWTISFDEAARDGYRKISPQISEIIMQQITQ